eukprot:GSChrysophyteH1.ASY1.ANO1.247.1 assembled CDS
MNLPSLWLRDCCMCSDCKVVATSEKKFQCATVASDISPKSCVVGDDHIVRLTWPDGHETCYEEAALRAFADKPLGEGYGTLMDPPAAEQAQPWPKEFQPHRISLSDLLKEGPETITALTDLLRHGVFLVTGASSVQNTLERLAPVFGPMHEVLFERVHNAVDVDVDGDVDDDKMCYNIAHTGLAVPPHNDFASYTWNPSVQCLHMLVNEATGGQSCVVDGWAALEYMQENHPEYFDVLKRFKVPFREFDENNETYTEAPIIRCDVQTGEITALRYSNQLMQAINPLHPEAGLFYQAYHMLSPVNSQRKDRCSFRANSGDIIVVAAHRVLHARSHIHATGHRHLQDAYFCHDNLRNKRTLLLRKRQEQPSAVTTAADSCKARKLMDFSKADIEHMTVRYNQVCTPEHLAQRVIAMLEAQNTPETKLGCRVSLYEHGLQTATRAHRAGADEETVVCALLHDVGELVSPSSHGDMIAGILQPYISPKNQWVLRMHEVFQGYHYFEHIPGANKHKREEFKSHEYYSDCVKFCDDWDQTSFDDEYDSYPLAFFKPMVVNVFAKTPYWWDASHPKALAVLGGNEEIMATVQ